LEALLSGNAEGGAVSHAEYRDALVSARPALQAAIAAYFEANTVEAMIYPTTMALARPVEEALANALELNGTQVLPDEGFARNTCIASTVSAQISADHAGLTAKDTCIAGRLTSRNCTCWYDSRSRRVTRWP
jgi:hypothetical protein